MQHSSSRDPKPVGPKPVGHISTSRLIAYGSLAVPLQVLLNPMLIFLPPFYAAEMGLSLAAVGALFFVARAWDALTDPVIGALSDRSSSRFGRRRPWILAGTPLILIASYYVLVPGEDASILSLGLAIFAFYVFWTMVFIPYQSWGAEISSDYEQRTRIAGYREAGTVLGVLVGIGIPLLLVDPVAAPVRAIIWPEGLGLDPSLRNVLMIVFFTILMILPVTAIVSCWFVPDRQMPPSDRLTWKQTASVIVRNKPFRRLFIGYLIAQLGFLIFLSAVQMLITRGLEIKAFLLLVFVQHLVAIVTVPIWLRLAAHYGKHAAYCASLVFIIIGFLALNFVQPGALWMAVLLFMFNGLGSSGKLILPASLAADTIDYDTLKTGTREAGSHIALLNVANKITFAVSIGVTFVLLSFTGFDPASDSNSESAIDALMIIGTILPASLLAIGVAIMWSFPLTKTRHDIVRRRLEQRSSMGTAPLSSS